PPRITSRWTGGSRPRSSRSTSGPASRWGSPTSRPGRSCDRAITPASSSSGPGSEPQCAPDQALELPGLQRSQHLVPETAAAVGDPRGRDPADPERGGQLVVRSIDRLIPLSQASGEPAGCWDVVGKVVVGVED